VASETGENAISLIGSGRTELRRHRKFNLAQNLRLGLAQFVSASSSHGHKFFLTQFEISIVLHEVAFRVGIYFRQPVSGIFLVDRRFQSLCVIGEVVEHGNLPMFRTLHMLRGIPAIAHQFNLFSAAILATRNASRRYIRARLLGDIYINAQM
jgi:hypothetical protein